MNPIQADTSPLPSGSSMPLESVLRTEELNRRPSRPPDYESENRALASLMEEMANTPESILQKLVEKALALCRAHSAGISILEVEAGRKVFKWHATAGQMSRFLGNVMPRDASPCGTVLDQDRALLMSYPQRHFPFPPELASLIGEVLLIPFHVGGKVAGTVWVVARDESRQFDREDERLMSSLARFAATAYQVLSAEERLGAVNAELAYRVAEVQVSHRAALKLMEDAVEARQLVEAVNVELRAEAEERKRAKEALHASEERQAFLLKLSDVLRRVADPVAIQAEASRVLGEHLGVNRALYTEIEADGEHNLVERDYTRGVPSFAGRYRSDDFGAELMREARAGRTFLVADTTTDPRLSDAERAAYAGINIAAHVAVPLVKGGRLAALFVVMQAPPRAWTAAEVSLVEETAERTWAAVERAKAESALRDSEVRFRSLYEEREGLVGQLRDADRKKDEFLATLAHELRNPLAPMRNGLQVMKLANNNATIVERSRAMMERQLGQLVRLVDDLLDVSRISQGKIELKKERIELTEVVATALESSEPIVEQHGHELTVTLPGEPAYVDADKTRLAQALCNLLNNAAKYTEKGGHIWLTVERRGSEAVLSVKDTGVGIPSPMLPQVFDLFTQVDRSLEKSQSGLGIGLTIVKRLIEMHGGSIEVKSEGSGMGSEFIIRLPIVLSLIAPHETEGDGERAVPMARRRILVVDDNADAASSLAMLLEIVGNEVRTARDGLEGMEVAAAFRPDLIFLDIGMPKLNGYDACRRIRQEPWSRAIVMVALSGWGQEEDKRRSREAGFNAHLVKPVDLAALEKLLADSLIGAG